MISFVLALSRLPGKETYEIRPQQRAVEQNSTSINKLKPNKDLGYSSVVCHGLSGRWVCMAREPSLVVLK